METTINLGDGQTWQFGPDSMLVNGQQIRYEDISAVGSAWTTNGLVGIITVAKFNSVLNISVQDSPPLILSFAGWCFYGLGGWISAKSNYKKACAALYQKIGPSMVQQQ